MTKPPEKFKSIEDYTPAEHVEHQARLARGEINPKIESEQYRAYRREVLRAGGIEPDEEDDPPPLEDMTAEQHARRLQQGQR
jgi:hypothetical protein